MSIALERKGREAVYEEKFRTRQQLAGVIYDATEAFIRNGGKAKQYKETAIQNSITQIMLIFRPRGRRGNEFVRGEDYDVKLARGGSRYFSPGLQSAIVDEYVERTVTRSFSEGEKEEWKDVIKERI